MLVTASATLDLVTEDVVAVRDADEDVAEVSNALAQKKVVQLDLVVVELAVVVEEPLRWLVVCGPPIAAGSGPSLLVRPTMAALVTNDCCDVVSDKVVADLLALIVSVTDVLVPSKPSNHVVVCEIVLVVNRLLANCMVDNEVVPLAIRLVAVCACMMLS